MRETTIARPEKAKAWSACPNCLLDLRAKAFGGKPLYDSCPFCGVKLTFVWWQRLVVTIGALILAYAVPAVLGARGLPLLFFGFLCYWPALVAVMFLFVRVIPTKYAKEGELVQTLFRR